MKSQLHAVLPVRKIVCVLALASALALDAGAQTPRMAVRFDPASTEIRWTLGGVPHSTHGTFKLKGGLVTLDPATGAAAGELLVDLSSGESGNQKRDAKMQSDVLQSNKYPEAFFHPSRITGMGKAGTSQTLQAEGTFNIHGVDHPMTMTIAVTLNGDQATATTHFTVPYVAWGMKDPSAFLLRVNKEVEIDIVAHGTVKTAPAAGESK